MKPFIQKKENNVKRLLAVCAFLSLVPIAAGQNSIWFEGTFAEAKAEAKERGTPILIDFFSDG